MIIIGHILFGLGVILWLIGNTMFLAIVFRYSSIWFLGCLSIPLLDWIYFLFNAKRTWKPALLTVIGCLITCFGYWLGGFH